MDELIERIATVLRRNPNRSPKHCAAEVVCALGFTEEVHPNHPISVPEVDAEGNPVMDERWVTPQQKRHFEWVTMRRFVTPYEEIGERETSEQLSARLEQNRHTEESAHG